jgi:phosphate transport system substrate-binding protein
MNQKKHFKEKKMKKTLFAVLAILTLLTGCSKSENTNTVSTDGLTSMEKVIGILGEVFTENNKGFGGVLVY